MLCTVSAAKCSQLLKNMAQAANYFLNKYCFIQPPCEPLGQQFMQLILAQALMIAFF